jgi:hypothetical protein
MSAFEFAFTLFGLVLGLALTAVLAGLVSVLKARSSAPGEAVAIRIGWLTPLMALVVIFDLITFWLGAWNLREEVVVTLPLLVFGAVLTGIYFVAASLVFPEHPERWPDLDQWFQAHKAQIAAGIVIANIGFTLSHILGGLRAWTDTPLMQYAYVLLMLSLTVTRRPWQSLTVLVLISSVAAWSSLGLPVA